MKTKIIVLRGVPGSGKSTLALQLEKNLGFTRISSDELGLKAWKAPLRQAIERGDPNIVIDRCHSTHKQRMHLVRTISPYKNQIETTIVTLPELPFDELRKRIANDVGHTYGVDKRTIALRVHSKDRQNDFISMAREGWDNFIKLEDNNLKELVSKIEGE